MLNEILFIPKSCLCESAWLLLSPLSLANLQERTAAWAELAGLFGLLVVFTFEFFRVSDTLGRSIFLEHQFEPRKVQCEPRNYITSGCEIAASDAARCPLKISDQIGPAQTVCAAVGVNERPLRPARSLGA